MEEKTSKPVLGVLPFLHGLELESEDSISSEQNIGEVIQLRVVVPVLTRMSNNTDFEALRAHQNNHFRYFSNGEKIYRADLVILPGTKSVRSDLDYLRSQNWDKDIQRHVRLGGKLIGICGGYQMLGRMIRDPYGVEGEVGMSHGLNFYPLKLNLPAKTTH